MYRIWYSAEPGQCIIIPIKKVSMATLVVYRHAQFEGIKRRQELFQPCDAVQILSAKINTEQILPVWFKGLSIGNTLNKSVMGDAE